MQNPQAATTWASDQTRSVRRRSYGDGIEVELCDLFGIIEPFPRHFHDYYTIGLMVGGRRRLECDGRIYLLETGDIVLLNPGEVHACESPDGSLLDYRSFGIGAPAMEALLADLGRTMPVEGYLLDGPVMRDGGVYAIASSCYVGCGEDGREQEAEAFFLFMGRLLESPSCTAARVDEPGGSARGVGRLRGSGQGERKQAVDAVCGYLDGHHRERITLDEMATVAGLSRYALLRAFTREKGITPYRYLTTRRIIEARCLLAQGAEPAVVASELCFSDQAHFGRVFKEITGVSPGAYRTSCAEGKRLGNAGI